MERQVCLVSELVGLPVESGADRERLQLRVQLSQVFDATWQRVHISFLPFATFITFFKSLSLSRTL